MPKLMSLCLMTIQWLPFSPNLRVTPEAHTKLIMRIPYDKYVRSCMGILHTLCGTVRDLPAAFAAATCLCFSPAQVVTSLIIMNATCNITSRLCYCRPLEYQ
eukprot:jgi/Botrbrau1/3374/Bobra.0337s0015.1